MTSGLSLHDELLALAQVVLIDVTLAGDNAIVVGLAVAGLPPKLRGRAILAGIAAATLVRVALALVAVRLLAVLGLTLAGGLLLLWVCWKMFRELRRSAPERPAEPGASLRAAIIQIAVADLSMSLDNVLAVAGAAHASPRVLIAGLVLSILLMAAAAGLLARLLARHRWIAWIGLAVVLEVALRMIWQGSGELLRA